MIKFAPFIEYKMDKCYLTEIECVGVIVRQMADWDTDKSCDVLSAIYDGSWTHRFNVDKNQTEYEFGGDENRPRRDYTAIFGFTPDHEYVELRIYAGDPEDEYIVFSHKFDDDEMMGFVDYLTYKDDPKRLEHYSPDDDWDFK